MKILNTTLTTLAATSLLSLGLLAGCDKNPAVPAAEAQDNTQTENQPDTQNDNQFPSVEETREIAEEAYIYGMPIAINYATMYEYAVDKKSGQYKAPFNDINNNDKPFTYKDTAIVTANSDTPYSMAWLDLRAEPIVVSVPDVDPKRYYSVMLVDSNLYNYGYIGSRATGSKAGSYLIVPPDWNGDKPEGIDAVFQSSTPFTLAAFRTQLFDKNDSPNVAKVQKGYKITPLSKFLGEKAPEAAPKIDFVPANTKKVQDNFWHDLDAALEFIPEDESNKEILDKLARIGVGPKATFGFEELPPDHQKALQEGLESGTKKVTEYVTSGSKNVNGWQISNFFGDKDFINGKWIVRAAGAQGGIYGNDAVEATYPLTKNDTEGKPLDASKNNFTLTFEKDNLPPVNAFWSVTMYDAKTQLLIKNPINRYLINSSMLADMKKNPDGSATIYIQYESPGKDKEANWLPAPNGPIYVPLRLYWPKPATENPSILPPGEGTWKPPAIKVTNK